jgi:hypothetical protein
MHRQARKTLPASKPSSSATRVLPRRIGHSHEKA